MRAVNITRNAKLIQDDEGYWLSLKTSAGWGMFRLSHFITDPVTGEEKSVTFEEVLGAYMKDQTTPQTGSQN